MNCLELVCRRLRIGAVMVAGAFFVFSSAPGVSVAQDIPAPAPAGMDKMVGAVAVLLPDYEGSEDYTFALAPLLMYKFKGERYVQLVGNKAYLNVLNHPNWEAGLKVVFRGGRSDVKNSLVDTLDGVDSSLELGGFVGYKQVINSNVRHRWNINFGMTQDVSDGHDGYVAEVRTSYWKPVAKAFDIGFTAGVNYASGDYMSSFFDVSAAESAATGITTYNADSGFKDVKIGLMGVFHLSQKWHVGGGVNYGHLLGDAEDSSIVSEQGSANQLFAGLSVLYTW
jgi:outer membrane protein